MGETILVTGSTGFIGSRMLSYLAEGGSTIRVFLRPESSGQGLPEGVQVVRGSFSDLDALGQAVRGIDRIVHLAGLTKAVDEAGYNAGNVIPVRNLLAVIKEHNPALKRFLLVSSLAAAGPAMEGRCGVRESDQASPVSAYGRSKLRAETLCLESSLDIPITIVRPPAVYGPGDRDILQVFQMLASGVLVTAGSGERQRFSMIYVDDLVNGIMMAACSERAVGRIYYITSSSSFSWDEVIAAARPVLGFKKLHRILLPKPFVFFAGMVIGAAGLLFGKPPLLNRDKANELVQDYWVCSPEQSERDLGFTAETSLAEGVAATIFWYRRKGWL
ncbi:MAG: NAD-dependent epimerase/dehydratase family protein [Chlorobiaceae bacterium]|nr:NAD-dependent epimerase/dehydratase family protein [Chlorobiaceae bacterium]